MGSDTVSSGGRVASRTESAPDTATATPHRARRAAAVEVSGRPSGSRGPGQRTMPVPMHAATGTATPHTSRYP